MKLEHGGDWQSYLWEYEKMPLDFSANISPLGLPDGVRQAVCAAAGGFDRYPDPQCRALRQALGCYHQIPTQDIFCGNGAAELLYRLVLAQRPKGALVTAPCFLEYEHALETVDCEILRFPLSPERDFRLTGDILSRLTPEVDMLFLCEPGNPTGVTTPWPLLLEILNCCRERRIRVVLDECFLPFLASPKSLISRYREYPNLVILRAFTKWYAMAGLRLGYCVSGDGALLKRMERCGQPWSVSAPAQAAGIAALREEDYSRRLMALISDQRPRMLQGLRNLGCRVIPGEANYLLFYHPRVNLPELLEQRGILIRDCSNYQGLGPGWYRVAIRTEPDNGALLKGLREVL